MALSACAPACLCVCAISCQVKNLSGLVLPSRVFLSTHSPFSLPLSAILPLLPSLSTFLPLNSLSVRNQTTEITYLLMPTVLYSVLCWIKIESLMMAIKRKDILYVIEELFKNE